MSERCNSGHLARLGRQIRTGTALAELTIGLVTTSIIGVVLVSALRADAAFVRHHYLRRAVPATTGSDSARLAADLRIVEATGGVERAGAGGGDVTLRVPFAYGLVCRSNGAVTTVSMLPVDSSTLAAPDLSGFAWRDASTGVYTYVTAAPELSMPGMEAACARAGIGSIPASPTSPPGRVVDLAASVRPAPAVGSVLFLYRRVHYD